MTLLNDPPLLFVAVFAFLVLMVEAGFRVGHIRGLDAQEVVREQLNEARNGSVLLLSLLLGFTLPMGLTRYDERKRLMNEEANELSTTVLRAELLPEPYSRQIAQLLTSYTDFRLAYLSAGGRATLSDADLIQTHQFQTALWEITKAVSKAAPTPITGAFLVSLNAAMDANQNQIATLENRVPASVWLMIILIAMLTCFAVGLSARRRVLFSVVLTPLMVAVVMSLIADLDSPGSGFIQVDTRSMQRLSKSQHAFMTQHASHDAGLTPAPAAGSEKRDATVDLSSH